jgi:hypothetical protein
MSLECIIRVIENVKAVDGEVRVPRVDSLKRHILKRFQKVNSFESSILKDLSEKVSILYPNIDGVSNPCNCREKTFFYLFITVHLLHILPLMFLSN